MCLHQVIIFVTCLCLFITSCGGGGGGGGDVGAGNASEISLSASPRRIDSGDRTSVTIRLRNIQVDESNGLMIKILHPGALRYVDDSGILSTHSSSDGSFTPSRFEADEASYTLFFIDTDDIDPDHRWADIEFEFRARGIIEDGVIAIDIDKVNQDNRGSFDTSNPLFTSLDELSVTVE